MSAASTGSDSSSPKAIIVEDDSEFNNFVVNTAFWRRAFRVLRIGLGDWRSEGRLWFWILVNIIAQVLAGYILQCHFYYTATGTGSQDPGMVRFL